MKSLTQDQVSRLLDSIREREPFGRRDRALIQLALHTGLRSLKLCGLDVGHVYNGRQPREWLDLPGAIAKGGKGRMVPLNTVARQAVAELVDFNRCHGFSVAAGAPLLVTRDHRRLPTRSLRARIQRYRERAQLDIQASPHTLRHTMATDLASKAGNLRVVQRVLGHAHLNTVEVYTHTTPEEMARAMERLSG